MGGHTVASSTAGPIRAALLTLPHRAQCRDTHFSKAQRYVLKLTGLSLPYEVLSGRDRGG